MGKRVMLYSVWFTGLLKFRDEPETEPLICISDDNMVIYDRVFENRNTDVGRIVTIFERILIMQSKYHRFT